MVAELSRTGRRPLATGYRQFGARFDAVELSDAKNWTFPPRGRWGRWRLALRLVRRARAVFPAAWPTFHERAPSVASA